MSEIRKKSSSLLLYPLDYSKGYNKIYKTKESYNMIDLHTHTIFSDGTWTLKEMLVNAEKVGISTLAITDHDTAMPHIKLKEIDAKSYFSGRIYHIWPLLCWNNSQL